MNIKEIFERYKSKLLKCELEEIKSSDFGDIGNNILEEKYYLNSLSMKDFFLESESRKGRDLKKAKSYFLYDLRDVFEFKNAWNKIKIEGDFKEEDFKIENIRKSSEAEKTEKLLFLLKNYKHIIEDEKINMLSYSAMCLENNNEEKSDLENKKQGVQARYEIYKYLTGDESKDEIPKIYKTFIENMGYSPMFLLEMLENKNFDKFLNKQNDYYKKMINDLRKKMPKEDIDKLLNFFRDISRKFKFSFKSIISDFETYSNYSLEMEKIDELEKSYMNILEEERKEEKEAEKRKIELAEENRKKEEAQKNNQDKKTEIKKKKRIDFEAGNIDEYLEFLKENPISENEKENVKILFIHWIFHKGEKFEDVLDKEKREILFDKIKKITETSDKKVSIFLCTDEKEENLRELLNSFDKNLKEHDIENVILEGASGEHGRFMIDSQGRRFEMYHMPKETFDGIRKVHDDVFENMDEYLDNKNQSFLEYNMPCSKKNGERLEDYLMAFRRCFFLERKNIRYYPSGKNRMLVLTRHQFQDNVKNRILSYYKEKYKFTDKDVINNLGNKDEKEVGDEQK